MFRRRRDSPQHFPTRGGPRAPVTLPALHTPRLQFIRSDTPVIANPAMKMADMLMRRIADDFGTHSPLTIRGQGIGAGSRRFTV